MKLFLKFYLHRSYFTDEGGPVKNEVPESIISLQGSVSLQRLELTFPTLISVQDMAQKFKSYIG